MKNKHLRKFTLLLAVALTVMVTAFWGLRGSSWTRWDYQILDLFFQKSVKDGHGPKISPRISLITLTEETKGYFGQTILDRTVFADINNNLASLGIEATAYDIIFVLKSNETSDTYFKDSLKNLKKVYLPIGLNVDESAPPFKLDERIFFDRIKPFIGAPIETGTSDPFVGSPYLMQYQPFFEEAHNTGHINIETDADGVYRQLTLLIQVDSGYLPALALSIFLDHAGIPLEKIEVHWGNEIRIPALPGSRLVEDVVIPIDRRGRTYIPFVQFWEEEKRNFKQVPIHYFLTLFEDLDTHDSLKEFFKDNFVFIGDVSLGSKDIGQTPLEDRVPLMTLQASILNGLLNNTFYKPRTLTQTIGLILSIAVLLFLSTLPKSSWFLFGCGGFLLLTLIGWAWPNVAST
ncbi:MAG: CHASE2 domain-containing protein [Nitrospinales bacterium]